MAALHSHEGTYNTCGEIFFSQQKKASLSSVQINCSGDNLKDKSEKKGKN